MNALIRTVLAAALLSCPAVALADDDAVVTDPTMTPPPPPQPYQQQPAAAPLPKRTFIGGDLAVVIPLGDYADGADFAAGPMLRFEYAASPTATLSVRGGYLWHKTDTPEGSSGDLSLSMIPLLIGGTFNVGGGAFLYGEVGLNVVQVTAHFMGLSASESETYLSAGAGVGFAQGQVKGRVGFWMPGRPENTDSDGMGTTTTTLYGVLATIGYDFAAL